MVPDETRQEKGIGKGRRKLGHRKKEIVVICEKIQMQRPPRCRHWKWLNEAKIAVIR
jgi:hypothetical protein